MSLGWVRKNGRGARPLVSRNEQKVSAVELVVESDTKGGDEGGSYISCTSKDLKRHKQLSSY